MPSRTLTLLFAAALFLGSALLFLLEPMFGRMVLPLLGGASAGWTTCLLFFQVTLLLGYLYAWATARWLAPRAQILVHAMLLLSALIVLPIGVSSRWTPPSDSSPAAWLLGLMTVSIGLPFLAVATTSPVLQHWFSRGEHPEAEDPYFLYQASNLGSIAALLSYSAIVEPWFGVRTQSVGWAWAYGAFALLVAFCAFVTHTASPIRVRNGGDQSFLSTPVPSWGRQLRWLAFSAVPSSLLLGVTSYITTDVAPVPLLWIIPLIIYLLTFVLSFARPPLVPRGAMLVALPVVVLAQVTTIAVDAYSPAWLLVPLHLLAFGVVAMVCHRELAEDRPARDHLTLFYLWLAIGGTLGGLFNAIVAPRLFTTMLEYPLVIVAACFLKPPRVPARAAGMHPRDVLFPIAVGVVAVGLFLAVPLIPGGSSFPAQCATAAGLAVLCLSVSGRPVRFGLAVAAFLLASTVRPSPYGELEHVERSFFGVHRVAIDRGNNLRLLYNGNTLHGAQSLAPGRERVPLTYYTRRGPIGEVFAFLQRRGLRSVAVVGLGTGSLSSYATAGQSWAFFELDPTIVRLAGPSGFFSYLRACAVRPRVVVGDARWSLARPSADVYDLLVIDAFSSDAVPVHLLTREALRVYLSRLSPDGVIAFHTSNRYMRLERPVADLAKDAGLACLWKEESPVSETDEQLGYSASDWVVLSRRPEALSALASSPGWSAVPGTPGRVWTDDYVNTLSVLRWK
jgi:hypothetical protein